MNQGMHNELMGQLMQLNAQLTEIRTLLRAMAGPVAEQSRGAVEAAEEVTEYGRAGSPLQELGAVKATEPKKFKKAKGGG